MSLAVLKIQGTMCARTHTTTHRSLDLCSKEMSKACSDVHSSPQIQGSNSEIGFFCQTPAAPFPRGGSRQATLNLRRAWCSMPGVRSLHHDGAIWPEDHCHAPGICSSHTYGHVPTATPSQPARAPLSSIPRCEQRLECVGPVTKACAPFLWLGKADNEGLDPASFWRHRECGRSNLDREALSTVHGVAGDEERTECQEGSTWGSLTHL